MDNWIEMFKWMSIGFAGCGLAAFLIILVAKSAMRQADEKDRQLPLPQICACGKKPVCYVADRLGMCHANGRVFFICHNKRTPRPSLLWWLKTTAFLTALVLVFVFDGPWKALLSFHPFLVAVGVLFWSLAASLIEKEKPAP